MLVLLMAAFSKADPLSDILGPQGLENFKAIAQAGSVQTVAPDNGMGEALAALRHLPHPPAPRQVFLGIQFSLVHSFVCLPFPSV